MRGREEPGAAASSVGGAAPVDFLGRRGGHGSGPQVVALLSLLLLEKMPSRTNLAASIPSSKVKYSKLACTDEGYIDLQVLCFPENKTFPDNKPNRAFECMQSVELWRSNGRWKKRTWGRAIQITYRKVMGKIQKKRYKTYKKKKKRKEKLGIGD
ncbi:transmembrane protein 230 isoform X2 [Thamnophis elegans]|uniref:transmembrane protein 230 isoform X2 n=1 Tax=Thamnophis elegans TaxID=35005 RepID=UPI0013777C4F|nr:transmembrane protein 230 isoform X2 [Thamnophis elegans]